MEYILSAVGLGLLLAILIGPVFFMLLQISIDHGFKSGILVAAGIIVSDITYIVMVYFGLSGFISSNIGIVSIIGGSIFIVFGVITLFKVKKSIGVKQVNIESKTNTGLLLRGFIINGLSPFVPLFWIATIGTLSSSYTNPDKILSFLAITIATVFLTDLIKAKLAHKLSEMVTSRFITTVKTVAAFVFIVAGIRILFMA